VSVVVVVVVSVVVVVVFFFFLAANAGCALAAMNAAVNATVANADKDFFADMRAPPSVDGRLLSSALQRLQTIGRLF
jgi:hypothetical protein